MRIFLLLLFCLTQAALAGENQATPEELETLKALNLELKLREDINKDAFKRSQELCYVFIFRQKNQLPLQTKAKSFLAEDWYLITESTNDAQLRESLKAWGEVAARGAKAPFQLERGWLHALLVAPEFLRGVSVCSEKLKLDIFAIMKAEIVTTYTTSSIASAVGTFVASAYIFKKGSQRLINKIPRAAKPLRYTGLALSGLTIIWAVNEIYVYYANQYAVNQLGQQVHKNLPGSTSRCTPQLERDGLEGDLAQLSSEFIAWQDAKAQTPQLPYSHQIADLMVKLKTQEAAILAYRQTALEEINKLEFDPAAATNKKCELRQWQLKLGTTLIYQHLSVSLRDGLN